MEGGRVITALFRIVLQVSAINMFFYRAQLA